MNNTIIDRIKRLLQLGPERVDELSKVLEWNPQNVLVILRMWPEFECDKTQKYWRLRR